MEELLKQIELLKNEVASIKLSKSLPLGVVEAFATPTPPAGWLVCNGQELRIDDYRELFNAIGKVYNNENTSEGFFRIPDLQGQFIRGWDADGNTDPERDFGSSQEDALQGHGHDIVIDVSKIHTESAGGHFHYVGCNKYPTYERDGIFSTTYHHEHVCSYDDTSKSENKSTDRDGTHTHNFDIENGFVRISNSTTSNYGIIRIEKETRPKNVALLYCIKAK